FPVPGFTAQATAIHNRNNETAFHYDQNGFLVRPASIGFENPRRYEVTYLGLNGDGHFGRLNLTLSGYYAVGRDKKNPFTDAPARISPYFLAAEPSIYLDFIRLRLSGAYASGDADPFKGSEHGF